MLIPFLVGVVVGGSVVAAVAKLAKWIKAKEAVAAAAVVAEVKKL